MTVYMLTLTDTELSYENHSEDFGIGIFSSREKAEETAQEYLHHVPGFCEYPCTYRIEEKTIVDAEDALPAFVWMCTGWNVNKDQDETDIVESNCYVSEKKIQDVFEAMKHQYPRMLYTLDIFEIDRREWEEGFCRV